MDLATEKGQRAGGRTGQRAGGLSGRKRYTVIRGERAAAYRKSETAGVFTRSIVPVAAMLPMFSGERGAPARQFWSKNAVETRGRKGKRSSWAFDVETTTRIIPMMAAAFGAYGEALIFDALAAVTDKGKRRLGSVNVGNVGKICATPLSEDAGRAALKSLEELGLITVKSQTELRQMRRDGDRNRYAAMNGRKNFEISAFTAPQLANMEARLTAGLGLPAGWFSWCDGNMRIRHAIEETRRMAAGLELPASPYPFAYADWQKQTLDRFASFRHAILIGVTPGAAGIVNYIGYHAGIELDRIGELRRSEHDIVTMAATIGIAKRTAERDLAQLIAAGHVSIVRRYDAASKRSRAFYRLNLPNSYDTRDMLATIRRGQKQALGDVFESCPAEIDAAGLASYPDAVLSLVEAAEYLGHDGIETIAFAPHATEYRAALYVSFERACETAGQIAGALETMADAIGNPSISAKIPTALYVGSVDKSDRGLGVGQPSLKTRRVVQQAHARGSRWIVAGLRRMALASAGLDLEGLAIADAMGLGPPDSGKPGRLPEMRGKGALGAVRPTWAPAADASALEAAISRNVAARQHMADAVRPSIGAGRPRTLQFEAEARAMAAGMGLDAENREHLWALGWLIHAQRAGSKRDVELWERRIVEFGGRPRC